MNTCETLLNQDGRCPDSQLSPRQAVHELERHINREVLGQASVVRNILVTLLCDGNLLLEGFPGLAKTRVIRTMARYLEGDFRRIQFTPDLLPSDITGAEMYFQDGGRSGFTFRAGPLFGHLVLIDEINRAPAKVQSALLEAMEERQVTVAGVSHQLPKMFMTLATQNPVEQEGTYPLPEAQLDRFLMKVLVQYPEKADEKTMLGLVRHEQQKRHGLLDGSQSQSESKSEQEHDRFVISQQSIFDSWREIAGVHVSDAVETYIIDLVDGTRHPSKLDDSGDLFRWIRVGASPRASLSLERAARAHAWLEDRSYVTPADVHAIAHPVLRHRLALSHRASSEGVDADQVIDRLLSLVLIP